MQSYYAHEVVGEVKEVSIPFKREGACKEVLREIET